VQIQLDTQQLKQLAILRGRDLDYVEDELYSDEALTDINYREALLQLIEERGSGHTKQSSR
jgi:hypothetical protein